MISEGGIALGFGGFEILFVGLIVLLSLGVPAVIVVFAVRMTRSDAQTPPVVSVEEGAATKRCASCDSLYLAEYDACPYCARNAAVGGSLDVTRWGNGKVTSLLVASLWPVLYVFIFLGLIFLLAAAGESGRPEAPTWFFALFGAHIFTILLSFALMGVYLFIAIKSPISSNAKLLWAVALFFGGMVAFLLAFYFLVWEPRARAKRLRAVSDAPAAA